jgi:hypothetical protein
MRRSAWFFGLLLFVLVAGTTACAGGSEVSPDAASNPESVPAEAPAEDSPPAAARGQDSAVDYDSTTHGALQVMSVRDDPSDWFVVLRDGEPALPGNPPLLNNTVELAPGTYVVDVNRTRREVSIEAGRKTVIWTGELLVEGEPSGAYWYPMRGDERMLTTNPSILNASRPLFPGTYTVFVHVTVTRPDTDLGAAEVRAGETTVLQHQAPG